MTEMATLRGVIQEEFEAALDSGRVIVGDVADAVIEKHGDLVADLAQSLGRSQVMRLIRELARAESESDAGQLSLLGFPSVLAIPSQDDYIYTRSARATWCELVEARAVRAENVTRAQRKLDIYDEALDKVRPVLEGTQRTLADAVEMLSDAA